MADKIKVGLVGCGTIAIRSYLPEISQMPKAELVAVCDVVEERAATQAAKFKVPLVYTDLDGMLERSGIDLLVNTTHIQAHFETNLKALRAGKHVYSEKPLAGSVQEATILDEEAKKRNLKLGVAAATMLSSVNQWIGQLIRNGAIGKVCFAISHNSHSGGKPDVWATDTAVWLLEVAHHLGRGGLSIYQAWRDRARRRRRVLDRDAPGRGRAIRRRPMLAGRADK